MTIQSIELEHTNPSLGPHETRTTVTLRVTKDNSQVIHDFINTSKINETASLYEYLEAVKTENKTVLDRISSNAPVGKLNAGSTISNLMFHFEDGQTVELSDVYRKFQLSDFYPKFTSYMVENGTVNNYSSNFQDSLKPIDFDDSSKRPDFQDEKAPQIKDGPENK